MYTIYLTTENSVLTSAITLFARSAATDRFQVYFIKTNKYVKNCTQSVAFSLSDY